MTHRYLDRVYLREPVPAGSYLAALPAVRALGDREHPLKIPADVTFLVGENGTGKSTLLEAVAVACGFNAEGGTRNFSFSTRETHSPPVPVSHGGADGLSQRRLFPPGGELLQRGHQHRRDG